MPKSDGFTISISPRGVDSAELTAPLPPHDLILRPILQAAELAVVLGAPADSRAIHEAAAILSKDRGRLRLTLNRDVIRGYERLWNTSGGDRGTIAIKSRITEEGLETLFQFCGRAWRWTPKGERGVFGTASLRFADKEVEAGCRVFLLSRSNGIEWLGVYSLPDESARLFEAAQRRCKPFKRWFEVSEPERYNIIGQYDRDGV